ncbi:nitrate/nitrite transporter NrtS [Alteromonas sp. AMM-1]|uniref:nitrate/nitrite transporter NrtS n=1 Tax=Alteromonas sp. AMM-1 TaxID=3394233 RepID=UPI0039A6DFBC
MNRISPHIAENMTQLATESVTEPNRNCAYQVKKCSKAARKITPALLAEALKTALVVGTIIMVINQFEAFEGTMAIDITKAALSYCVPFCVYLYGSLKVRD